MLASLKSDMKSLMQQLAAPAALPASAAATASTGTQNDALQTMLKSSADLVKSILAKAPAASQPVPCRQRQNTYS